VSVQAIKADEKSVNPLVTAACADAGSVDSSCMFYACVWPRYRR
jgi:hypothetical protein